MDDRVYLSRKEARLVGASHYFTGVACKHGHVCARATISKNCVECDRERATHNYHNTPPEIRATRRKSSYERNKQSEREGMKRYARENPERVAAIKSKWDKNNPDKIKTTNAAYYIREKDAVAERCRSYRQNNKERYAGLSARRRARKSNATPTWLTPDHHAEMLRFYEEAARLTVETGVIHHVDHIVPLQGKNICGLHVPWNLQVITMAENCSKGNRFD
jgi:hypothetical protein